MKRIFLILVAALALIAAVVFGIDCLHEEGRNASGRSEAGSADAALADAALADVTQIARGDYLARVGNCMACHTTRGGAAYAGGRLIATPFGDLYTPNITPDMESGIGRWTSDDFWRALHNGKSRDGSFLYPAFPYTEYTKMSRLDADAMFAYFKTLPAVDQPNRAHALRFPYNQRFLLAGWRALYFRPGVYQPESGQTQQWNRGAYLVQGLGHCAACHAPRNALGATGLDADLAGGLIPTTGWHAPALNSPGDNGLANWDQQHLVDFLKTGVSPRSTVFGPMAEVVRQSLQHLSDQDAAAMATYLKSLPPASAEIAPAPAPVHEGKAADVLALGQKLYGTHCVACHQDDGRGAFPAYPSLAGSSAVSSPSSINAIRMVLNGGYPPSTEGNSRPYGMAPFGSVLDDAQVAAVVSYIRNSWGNTSLLVSPLAVNRARGVPVE